MLFHLMYAILDSVLTLYVFYILIFCSILVLIFNFTYEKISPKQIFLSIIGLSFISCISISIYILIYVIRSGEL